MQELSESTSAQTERNFLIFWVGQIFSILGSWVVNFTLNWYIVSTYQDATIIATYATLTYLPFIIIMPFAGVWVDRWNKKTTILIFDSIIALSTVAYLVAFQQNITEIWLFTLLGAINTTCAAFHQTAMAAMVPLMIRRENLSRINGLRTLSAGGVRIIAPLLTGILLGFMSLQQTLWIDLITYAIAVGALLLIKLPETPKKAQGELRDLTELKKPQHPIREFFNEFKEGFFAIKNTPVLKFLIILALLANFLHTPFQTLYTFFIQTTHDGNTIDYSYLMMMSQIGLLAGSFLMTLKIKWKRKALWVVIGNISIGVLTIISVLAPYQGFWIMWVCNFLTGVTFGIIIANYYSILQESVAKELQGRIYAFDAFLSIFIMPIAMSLSGVLAELIEIQVLFLICEGLSVLMAFFMLAIFRKSHLNEPSIEISAASEKKIITT